MNIYFSKDTIKKKKQKLKPQTRIEEDVYKNSD